MIDPKSETLLRLNAAGHLPALMATGKPAGASSMWRYHKHGRESLAGRLVKLETIRLPAGIFTSAQAVDRFVAALNDQPDPAAPAATPASSASIDKAEAELADAGIC